LTHNGLVLAAAGRIALIFDAFRRSDVAAQLRTFALTEFRSARVERLRWRAWATDRAGWLQLGFVWIDLCLGLATAARDQGECNAAKADPACHPKKIAHGRPPANKA
jgi:hypothetical protein